MHVNAVSDGHRVQLLEPQDAWGFLEPEAERRNLRQNLSEIIFNTFENIFLQLLYRILVWK